MNRSDPETQLSALAANPADDSARRVYVEWLEERGDPLAEFFRVGERLRTIPLGDPSRREPGRRWRELRSALDPAWLARVEPPSPPPWWLPEGVKAVRRTGMQDFLESVGHSEWSIFAVLSPIEPVARLLIERRGESDPETYLSSGRWRRDASVLEGQDLDVINDQTPLIQLNDQSWTTIYYGVSGKPRSGYDRAEQDARLLSERLGTIAFETCSEGCSGFVGWQLFECGERIERAGWGAEPGYEFFSARRPCPFGEFLPKDPFQPLLRDIGLYVPACYPTGYDTQPALAIRAVGPSEVDRADLIEFWTPFPGLSHAEVVRLVDEGRSIAPRPERPIERSPVDFDPEDSDIPF